MGILKAELTEQSLLGIIWVNFVGHWLVNYQEGVLSHQLGHHLKSLVVGVTGCNYSSGSFYPIA